MVGRDEVGTLDRLKAYRAVVDGLIAAHRGRIFNTAGDSVIADFASAVDAVQCAVAVQDAIEKENTNRAAGGLMLSRIGIHVGDVIVTQFELHLQRQAVDVKQVRRKLGVCYVLEGSVHKASGHLRISVQLIEAITGAHLWADCFDGSLERSRRPSRKPASRLFDSGSTNAQKGASSKPRERWPFPIMSRSCCRSCGMSQTVIARYKAL